MSDLRVYQRTALRPPYTEAMAIYVQLVTGIVGGLAGGLVAWASFGPLGGIGLGLAIGAAGGALQVRLLTRRIHDHSS